MLNLFSWVTKRPFFKGLSSILLSLTIVACSDTDGPPEDLYGTAATGAATQGTVFVVDSVGDELSRPINADGSFRFDVRGMTAPFMLKTVADNGVDPDLFSYSAEVNVAVNITPLTNLALYIVNANADPGVLYNSWSSSFVNIAAADVINAQATVNANLATQYTAFSIDPFTYDFFATRFAANGTSIDALLDVMTVDFLANTIEIVGVAPITLNYGIPVDGYDIGGDSVVLAGAYSLVMNVEVDGLLSSDLLLSVNLPVSSVPTPIGNTQFVEDTFSSFYGSVGSILINSVDVTVTVDVDTLVETTVAIVNATITTLDNGDVAYIATYTYTPNP